MPLQPYTPLEVVIDLPPFVAGSISIPRQAEYVGHRYAQRGGPGGGPAVEVDTLVTARDEAGNLLPDTLFKSRLVTLYANNLTLVDAATGALLATRTPDMTPGQWQERLDSFEQPTQLQGNAFQQLLSQPVAVAGLIHYHMQAAVQLGRYA